MKKIIIVFLAFFLSHFCEAQERVGFLDSVCFRIDKALGKEKLDAFRAFLTDNTVGSIYDLPDEYRDELYKLDLNEWEGPLHDSLRGLIKEAFVSDYINTEDLVLKYYIGHITGEIYDVREAVRNQWEEEMEEVNKRKAMDDDVYNDFKVGDIVYFQPAIISPPKILPRPVTDMDVQPFEIIPCIIKEKTDSSQRLIVVFDEHIQGIGQFVKYIEQHDCFLADDNYRDAKSLLTIRKGEKVSLHFYHFQKEKPRADFHHIKFVNACYMNASGQIQLVQLSDSELGVKNGDGIFDYAPVTWQDDGFIYEKVSYDVVVNKNKEVLYLQNASTKEKYLPGDCQGGANHHPRILKEDKIQESHPPMALPQKQ